MKKVSGFITGVVVYAGRAAQHSPDTVTVKPQQGEDYMIELINVPEVTKSYIKKHGGYLCIHGHIIKVTENTIVVNHQHCQLIDPSFKLKGAKA